MDNPQDIFDYQQLEFDFKTNHIYKLLLKLNDGQRYFIAAQIFHERTCGAFGGEQHKHDIRHFESATEMGDFFLAILEQQHLRPEQVAKSQQRQLTGKMELQNEYLRLIVDGLDDRAYLRAAIIFLEKYKHLTFKHFSRAIRTTDQLIEALEQVQSLPFQPGLDFKAIGLTAYCSAGREDTGDEQIVENIQIENAEYQGPSTPANTKGARRSWVKWREDHEGKKLGRYLMEISRMRDRKGFGGDIIQVCKQKRASLK